MGYFMITSEIGTNYIFAKLSSISVLLTSNDANTIIP